MPTFPRGFINYQTNLANTVLVEALCRETGGNITQERKNIQYTYSASDWVTLRGIPAIGRGVGGAIPGTNPESRVTGTSATPIDRNPDLRETDGLDWHVDDQAAA